MIIKVEEAANLTKAIQKQYQFKGNIVDTMKESYSGNKLLILVDNYDQLKSPSNTLEINNF